MLSKKVELLVGFFVALGIAALLVLALKVANTGMSGGGEHYNLFAKFDNIGGLKVRSPIKVGGVVVGRVSDISLDETDYTPVVTLEIYSKYNQFSEATSVAILTAGLLGEQYIGLQPGFMIESLDILQPNDFIEDTKPALVLEELIGQFLFSQGSGD
ncbi:outer membrane lipid asymmetry maintenance protein MlaD [Colwellia sp. 4_MG-2023]|jgi:phospholipid/cholesterol/gamma-HCH transport system substrate-binding protein|uniref:outer membrane lipid asymmetry maintenance protein MlaD n=1 Tax=unclassified Colwellia TaxID=196834 RepID=UPI001C095178|nr:MULTISPECIES: outer membrane lipid asymmetry maintenance protein MlaD [unclassified Colwellia]MBU2925021.1 outer membrane lipid asymmetry maintenance protein MlaD [Colwellia sp. C2M11]MDO6486426.1 outer membrane lipid asymmetry maintenance protein MlaD [Colwellia sp. 6_MG-2023]MDO6506304.1 outer membrane lipid asymmetry maintenance protein MlaD [Colwellia sp. 5_MG-2023]MDO6555128.1 outer membrane lipid asymmetry maintenance protein MlaD [Colwellia sp. 4_MG-2023]MDO6651686.1 outer membrane l